MVNGVWKSEGIVFLVLDIFTPKAFYVFRSVLASKPFSQFSVKVDGM